ncbi:MAG: YciI family protein [Solirubrobacteraceae bacterium]
MLLIYDDPSLPSPERGTPEGDARSALWGSFTQQLIDDGVFVAGSALQDTGTGTTVRVRGGERLVTDGPFADTKEWLAGYYVIDVSDLDRALEYAANIPNIAEGSTEVRPVLEVPAAA